jgi:cytoskeletal protein RodZ
MSEFGSQLKQARESRGISLRQIATATKISTVALEALERGDLSRLPGGIFSRAFVKAYAVEVGLDPDEVVAQFLVELGEHASRISQDVARPEVTADDRAFLEQQRRAAVALRVAIGVLVLLIVAAVVAWRMRPTGSDDVPSSGAEIGEALPQVPLSPPPPLTAAAPPQPQATVDSAGTVVAALSIELTAIDNCWVQVTTDGTLVPARVFAPGERQRFDAAREIVLQVGSAGAVTWTVNGRPGRSLGRVGDVRTVTISSSNVAEFYQRPSSSESGALPTPIASATAHP